MEVGPTIEHFGFTHRNLTPLNSPFHSIEIKIRLKELLQALQEEFQHYPGAPFDGSTDLISEPFVPLIHRWDKLVDRAKSGQTVAGIGRIHRVIASYEGLFFSSTSQHQGSYL